MAHMSVKKLLVFKKKKKKTIDNMVRITNT